MKTIIRAYVPKKGGGEECIKDPEKIMKALSKPTAQIDVDWANDSGHVKMGTSTDFIGETVQVGQEEGNTFDLLILPH